MGFLTGPCVKLASPKQCVNELNERLTTEEGSIDVKKQFTYDKGSRSKVLVIYAIESEAREVDEMSCVMKSPRCKHVSYRQTTAQDRLAAMHNNEMKNRNGKCKTLENVKLNDEVLDEIKDEHVSLETALMDAEKGGKN